MNIKEVHGDITDYFSYRGKTFIVDKFDDFWLVTESGFLVKERGDIRDEVIKKVKDSYDYFLNQNK